MRYEMHHYDNIDPTREHDMQAHLCAYRSTFQRHCCNATLSDICFALSGIAFLIAFLIACAIALLA